MEYTNEFLARVYGAYYGCEVQTQPYLMLGTLISQESREEYVVGRLVAIKENECVIRYKSDHNSNSENGDIFSHISKYALCKLVLTPLSKITDEHANICANYCGLHTDGNEIKRYSEAIIVSNDTYDLQIEHNGYICLRKNGQLYNMDMRKVTDCLRSRGYDCGYGEIPSLIEAGIAIDKTTLTT